MAKGTVRALPVMMMTRLVGAGRPDDRYSAAATRMTIANWCRASRGTDDSAVAELTEKSLRRRRRYGLPAEASVVSALASWTLYLFQCSRMLMALSS